MPTILLASVGVAAAQAPPPARAPSSGTYTANIIIEEADGPGCLHAEGTRFTGVLNYDGLSGTTMGLRVPIVEGANTAAVSTQHLNVTSGVGTVNPQGNFTWHGRGLRLNWDKSGTFSATLTEIDKFSFLAQLTESYQGCTESRTVALTRIGPKQS